MSLKRVFLFLSLLTLSCHNLDDFAEKHFASLTDPLARDQGYVHFDDTGNIHVQFNNLQIKHNPSFNETSFISVWVFERGADVYAHCCSGSSDCSAVESKACLVGVGFSNDLGFADTFYIMQHPPQWFNKNAEHWYMQVYVADRTGVPTNYQGEYTHFSSPVNAVSDRAQYDLYLGVYYSIYGADAGFQGVRPILKTFNFGEQQYYHPVAPDLLSPRIPIEARFFSQSTIDPTGSHYIIPHLAEWHNHNGFPAKVDPRRGIVINEVGNAINGNTDSDFIELYNPTALEISMDGAYIHRYTDGACDTLSDATDRLSLSGITIPAGGYHVITRSDGTASHPLITDGFMTAAVPRTERSFTLGESDCVALGIGNKSLGSVNSTSVIDFVGLEDAARTNLREGSANAPYLGFRTSISRCANGQDTNENGTDFLYQTATPGSANTCTGSGAGQIFSTSFEAAQSTFNVVEAAGLPESNTCPAGTSARTGTQGYSIDSLTSSFSGRTMSSATCITGFTAGRPVFAEGYVQASTANGGNNLYARLDLDWYTGGACTTAYSQEAGGSVTLTQGSYNRVIVGTLPPGPATGLRITLRVQDDNGSPNNDDNFCFDDVRADSR
ncbi:MAG: lamin tail domain-containing protein [Spirochaetales bacterium]|nr:lamin tail domain-containing protein [Spirochaetales bacterium]